MTLDITGCHAGVLDVSSPCLCQHHGVAYAEFETVLNPAALNVVYDNFVDGATIVEVQITITKTCCVIVNSALLCGLFPSTDYEIERPKGTIRTQQETVVVCNEITMHHHASWELLTPGVYTYFLVNRAGVNRNVLGAWIKAIASDCQG